MKEFKAGTLHSGKKGPVVKSRKQAQAIGLNQARKAGEPVKPPLSARAKRVMKFEKDHGDDEI